MIAIQCKKGLVDASGCHIHVKEDQFYMIPSGETVGSPVYNLIATHWHTERDITLAQFNHKQYAEIAEDAIRNAVKKGEQYVSITTFEEDDETHEAC